MAVDYGVHACGGGSDFVCVVSSAATRRACELLCCCPMDGVVMPWFASVLRLGGELMACAWLADGCG